MIKFMFTILIYETLSCFVLVSNPVVISRKIVKDNEKCDAGKIS